MGMVKPTVQNSRGAATHLRFLVGCGANRGEDQCSQRVCGSIMLESHGMPLQQ